MLTRRPRRKGMHLPPPIPLTERAAFKAVVGMLILIAAGFAVYYLPHVFVHPPVAVNSDSAAGEWAMFRHDLRLTGAAGTAAPPPRGEQKWVFPTGAAVHSSPAVVDGTVYIGSRDHRLYALDAATGAKRWSYRTESWVESSPAVVDGVVYFGSQDGFLRALDARTSSLLWEFDAEYVVKSSPAVADGLVYFVANKTVYAVDAATGKERWHREAADRTDASPSVANGIVYIGSVNALHARNGWRRLHFKTFRPVWGTAAVVGETVYTVNALGRVVAFDGTVRNRPLEHAVTPYTLQLWAMGLWPRPLPPSGLLWGVNLGHRTLTAPTLDDGTLYVATMNGLVAVDLLSRDVRWEFADARTRASSPALAYDTVYAGADDGHLYAVNAATGAERWRFETGERITGSPAVVDGVVYVGSHDGNVYAVK